MELFGKTSINPFVFYFGKLAFVANFVFVFLRKYVETPELSIWILLSNLIILVIPGLIIFIVSLRQLGESLRVGLPEEETSLKTHGLYKYSRNPIYVSVYMLGLASCIYVPHWLNITLLVLAVAIHHFIIKAEEKFLLAKFKEQWVEYTNRVRRYI